MCVPWDQNDWTYFECVSLEIGMLVVPVQIIGSRGSAVVRQTMRRELTSFHCDVTLDRNTS